MIHSTLNTQHSTLNTQYLKFYFKKFFLFLLLFSFPLLIPLTVQAQAQNQSFFTFGNNVFNQGSWFELGGEMEAEMVATQKDTKNSFNSTTASPPVTAGDGVYTTTSGSTRFRFDKIMLKPKIFYPTKEENKFFVQGEFDFMALGLNGSSSDSAFAKELFFNFNLSQHFFLKVGLDDRFFAPLGDPDNRGTEIYPLNGTSFWRDEDWQVQLGADFSHLYFRTALSNGLTLNDMPVGKDATYQIIHDDRSTDDLGDSTKEIAAGIGLKGGEKLKFDLLGFGSYSKRSADEAQFLQDVFSGTQPRDNGLIGANFNVAFPIRKHDFNLFVQELYSKDGNMKRNGVYVQPSFTFKRESKESLSAFEFLYRWNWLKVEPSSTVDDITNRPMSWDRVTHTLALNIDIFKGLKLRNEAHLNRENKVSEVKNNEVLSQLEFIF